MYSMSFFLLQNTNWGILKNAGIETTLDHIDFHWIDKKRYFLCVPQKNDIKFEQNILQFIT